MNPNPVMPTYINELRVINYRSIVEETFSFGRFCNIIIGRNNSGKTNIMRALNLALGTSDPRLFYTDYYKADEDALVEIGLENIDTNLIKKYYPDYYSQLVKIIFWWHKPQQEPAHYPMGPINDPMAFEGGIKAVISIQVGEEAVTLSEEEEFHEELINKFFFVHIDSPRDYSTVTSGTSQANILLRLLQLYAYPAFNNRQVELGTPQSYFYSLSRGLEILATNNSLSEERIKDLRRGVESDAQGFMLTAFMDMIAELTNTLRNIPGAWTRMTILGYKRDYIDIWLGQMRSGSFTLNNVLEQITLYIDDSKAAEQVSVIGGPPISTLVPASQEGGGMQSLLVIGVVMLLRWKSAGEVTNIFGIDEPELGLHPHAQRNLLQMLDLLSQEGQIFISTHSPTLLTMLHLRDFRDTLLLVRRSNWTFEGTKATTVDGQKLDIHNRNTIVKHLRIIGGEIFFAQRVIIVEGRTEMGAIPALVKRVKGYSLDLNDVTVFMAGGATDIPVFIKLCRIFNIEYFAFFDIDALVKETKDRIHQRILEVLYDKSELTSTDVAAINKEVKTKLRQRMGQNALTRKDLEDVNKLLAKVKCYVLSSDFEGVFLCRLPTKYYPFIYKVKNEVVGKDQEHQDPPNPTYLSVSEMLRSPSCKTELYWLTLIDEWPSEDNDWISTELKQIINKVAGKKNWRWVRRIHKRLTRVKAVRKRWMNNLNRSSEGVRIGS